MNGFLAMISTILYLRLDCYGSRVRYLPGSSSRCKVDSSCVGQVDYWPIIISPGNCSD